MLCVEYQKEWLDTYLKILINPEHAGGYCEKLMLKHPKSEWLEVRKEQKENDIYYLYNITGLKSLKSIFSALPVKLAEWKQLLGQIIETLEEGREYLLNDTDFVLSESYLYVNPQNMKLYFCYVPGYGIPLIKQLADLFEYFLNRIDYSDRNLVELLYDCYQLCVTEQATLEKLKEKLGWQGEVREETPVSVVREEQLPEPEHEESYVNWLRGIFPFLNRDKSRSENKSKKRAEKEKEKADITNSDTKRNEWKEHDHREINAKLAEEEDESRTRILSVRKEAPRVQLLWEQTGEVIFIERFPFYVGSHAEYANFYCGSDGISRLHFCIKEKKGVYFLSDLNSTNGTYINQKEVAMGEEKRLLSGDVIQAGNEEFVFSCPE